MFFFYYCYYNFKVVWEICGYLCVLMYIIIEIFLLFESFF